MTFKNVSSVNNIDQGTWLQININVVNFLD